MAIDPAFLQQLQDYTNQQYNFRFGNYQTAKNNQDEATAAANLNIANNAKSSFANIQKLGSQYDFGPAQQDMLQQYIQGGGTGSGGDLFNQYINQQAQLASQQSQLKGLQDTTNTQYFGSPTASMTDALSGNQGALGQLNQFETQQTANTFNQQLKPLIQSQLGGMGLADSGGAQVELQSRALAGLQQAQQQSIEQAGLGMLGNIQGLQQQSTLGNIGTQQQNMANQQNQQNFYTTMAFQQSLMQQQQQLAQQLASYRGSSGGGGLGSLVGMGLGGILGTFAGPQGVMMGAGLGGQLGGAIGGTMSPGTGGYGPNMGSSFFAGAGSMPKTWSPTPMQAGPYSGPMNAQGSPWQMNPGFQLK